MPYIKSLCNFKMVKEKELCRAMSWLEIDSTKVMLVSGIMTILSLSALKTILNLEPKLINFGKCDYCGHILCKKRLMENVRKLHRFVKNGVKCIQFTFLREI